MADDWARPVVHWEIVARDPERQADFYRELFNWEIGGIKPDGHYYNGDVGPSPSGPADAGAPAGEVQITASAVLTSVGGVPACHPSTTSAVPCG